MASVPSISANVTAKKCNTNCCVYGCHSKKGKDRSIHFHYFPSKNSEIYVKLTNLRGEQEEIDKRKAWEKVLLMGKAITKSMRVCSKHFTKGDYCAPDVDLKQPKLRRHAVPSQNLPNKSFHRSSNEKVSSKLRRERLLKRCRNLEDTQITTSVGDEPLCEPVNHCNIEGEVRTYNHLSSEEKVVVQSLLDLNHNTAPSCDKGIQVSSGDIFTTFSSTVKNVSNLNSLTGIPSFELLDCLTTLISNNYPDQKIHKLSVQERVILVFMKLKMAIKFNVLAFLFKMCSSSCKRTFVQYIGYLSCILRCCIYWPTFNECHQNMPLCFREFKNVRVILDCLEIPMESPKCLCCRIRTHSHYKGKQTVKVMIGVSPAGLISFISKCYGGRSSDKAIFIQSNLIKKLRPRQDSVMVDKGFLIDEICQEHFIKLIRPHFLKKKKQFSESESKQNRSISRARVHVERVNQRIRIFNVLNITLGNTLVPLIDDIMVIVCGMVNLQNPVLASDKF